MRLGGGAEETGSIPATPVEANSHRIGATEVHQADEGPIRPVGHQGPEVHVANRSGVSSAAAITVAAFTARIARRGSADTVGQSA